MGITILNARSRGQNKIVVKNVYVNEINSHRTKMRMSQTRRYQQIVHLYSWRVIPVPVPKNKTKTRMRYVSNAGHVNLQRYTLNNTIIFVPRKLLNVLCAYGLLF